jgi:hypothetical protein
LARLQSEAVCFIKHTQLSYSSIILEVQRRWNRRISKGLVSYYRNTGKGRTYPLLRCNVAASEWDWLVGLCYADGAKFVDEYHHTIAFTLGSDENETLRKLVMILEKNGFKDKSFEGEE